MYALKEVTTPVPTVNAKSNLKEYLDQTGALPADAVLGHLVVFTIRDANYDRSVMEQVFDDLGLNPSYLPAPNNPYHAFLKATSSVNDTDYDMPHGQVGHVLVRDAKDDNEIVIRQLTREVRDPKKGKLGYSRIGDAVFYRPVTRSGKVQYGTERFRLTIDHAALHKDERPAIQTVIDKMNESYERHRDFMDAMKYRAVVRDYLLFLNALKVKDGLYFVHSNRLDELDKLRTLVERMGGGSTMWTMPLVNLAEQRKMVIATYEQEAEEALQDVIKEIQHVRSTRKSVTPAAYAKLKKRYDEAVTKANEHKRALKVRGVTQTASQDLALDLLMQVQESLLGNS